VDRAERTGFGVAVVAHAVLFAALSLSLLKPPELPRIDAEPIEVSIVDQVALESSAPDPAPAAPPAAAEPVPAEPQPAPPPPVVQPKPTTKPVSKPEPPKAKPAQTQRRPGLSRDLVAGLTDAPSAAGTPAKTIGPAIASSIGAEIRRQLKPHWKSPTGADVELLRTTLIVHLKRDGSIDGAPTLDTQTGVNESNRGQAKLHVDQAIRAVRLAAPFQLPAEYYDAWKIIRPTFDKRLSQ
jgi:hypothetical protein